MVSNRSTKHIGIVFLALGALSEIVIAFSYPRGMLVMQHYVAPAIFAFVGMTLCMGAYGKSKDLWAGVLYVAWYVISRILLKELYLDYSYLFLCNYACSFLLCLPFARTMDDVQKKRGLTVFAAIYVLGYGLLAWLSVFSAFYGETIVVPYLGTEIGIKQEASAVIRLWANTHPNGSAAMFVTALMLLVWLVLHDKRRWLVLPALVIGTGLYIAIAFTTSRTFMIVGSCFMAGMVGLGCLRLPFKRKWKRLSVALPAALLCILLVFSSFGWTLDGINNLIISTRAMAESTSDAEMLIAKKRSFLNDFATLTGRTDIYQATIQMFLDQPDILIRGLRNSEIVQVFRSYVPTAVNAHNAYLQVTANMGIPALILALWFTVRAVWAFVRMAFAVNVSFANQVLALIPLVLLIPTITEAILFTETLTFCNYAFYLCLGYVLEIVCESQNKKDELL